MRRTCRLLAGVKPSRYLEAGSPTGLTGLFTHPAPRSTLIYLYSNTLDKLKEFPESSVYRQSVESLTKHRLEIVTKAVPAGYEAWAEKAKKVIAEHPEVFNTPEGGVDHNFAKSIKSIHDGKTFVSTKIEEEYDDYLDEWNNEENDGPELEGVRTTQERADQAVLTKARPGSDEKTVHWEPEPPLTADQISEIENEIGAGLIEEVIQVAEGELKLVDVMAKSQVWEDLIEKPAEGQWTYFTRGPATPTTAQPPQK